MEIVMYDGRLTWGIVCLFFFQLDKYDICFASYCLQLIINETIQISQN